MAEKKKPARRSDTGRRSTTTKPDSTRLQTRAEAQANAHEQLESRGLLVDDLDTSGSLVRCKVEGDKGGKRSGWFALHELTTTAGATFIVGAFGNWKDSACPEAGWKLEPSRGDMSEQDRQAYQQRQREARERAAEEKRQRIEQAAIRAARIWPKLPDSGPSPYLQRKRTKPYGLKFSRGSIVVPVRTFGGDLVGLQFIDADGGKKFLIGTAKQGAFHLIGEITPDKPVAVAEGYATGATVHEATGLPVLVVFDAGNLSPVASELRRRYPQARVVICGDDDHATPGNPGKTKAENAAHQVGGVAVFPGFKEPEGRTDWNDLHTEQGLKAVRDQLRAALSRKAKTPAPEAGRRANEHFEHDWPDPGTFAGPEEEPYPIGAFPEKPRETINELHTYLKAPLPMIGSAVLAQMALPAQGLSDVARDDVLISPCSLNVLIVAESGERKSAIDGKASKGAKEWSEEEKEKLLPAHSRALAIRQTNNERKQQLIKKIGALEAKGGAEAEAEQRELEARLGDVAEQEVKTYVPPLPDLIHEDATLEAFQYAVGTGYPTSMTSSAEAGIILGGRGMSKESALAYITILNLLWDGAKIKQLRKQAKAADIEGVRFSLSLMMQPHLLPHLIEQGGRQLGFLARCLIAAPRSTMGTRFYTPPPRNLAAVDAFNARAKELLSLPLPLNDKWQLEPPVMHLDAEARELWAEYHDTVERELGEFGDLAMVRDVGAKSAENAARIACVLQIWDRGPGGNITAQWMASGIAIAAWHLNEAMRLFFQSDKPPEVRDAETLSTWLTTEARERLDAEGCLPLVEILQRGPYRLRDKSRRDAALKALADPEIAHLRLFTRGRKKMLQVNPKLLNRNASNE